MGEILKQCIVIEYKQVTYRPLTDIYKVVFLSPMVLFYVAFFSLYTIFMLHFPMLHYFHAALYSCSTFLHVSFFS